MKSDSEEQMLASGLQRDEGPFFAGPSPVGQLLCRKPPHPAEHQQVPQAALGATSRRGHSPDLSLWSSTAPLPPPGRTAGADFKHHQISLIILATSEQSVPLAVPRGRSCPVLNALDFKASGAPSPSGLQIPLSLPSLLVPREVPEDEIKPSSSY